MSTRYAHGEGGQAAFTVYIDLSPMDLDDFLGNRETQASTTRRLPTSRIASVKAIEYMLEMLGGYLLAMVAHGQDDIVILSVLHRPYDDHAIGASMSHGILEDVLEHTPHAR